jgi:threonyl-tRNA synthetase
MAEFGSCHRYEPSGAMHGIMRVRGFVQDDAHIFCTESQIENETKSFIDLLSEVYQELGFYKFHVKFSDRPKKRAGDDNVWDKAEEALLNATEAAKCKYELNPGEGAFYGPKLEFVLTDAIGREWQCGTLQVDFVLPERLDANYINEEGFKQRPVILHRAILGSFERFIGILIEENSGRMPLWLAPQQVAIASIITDANTYLDKIGRRLTEENIRIVIDKRNEKIGYKIREHSLAKVPIILAIGKKEMTNGTVAVRRLGNKETETMPLEDLISLLKEQVKAPDQL